jgi:hypothetical protein
MSNGEVTSSRGGRNLHKASSWLSEAKLACVAQATTSSMEMAGFVPPLPHPGKSTGQFCATAIFSWCGCVGAAACMPQAYPCASLRLFRIVPGNRQPWLPKSLLDTCLAIPKQPRPIQVCLFLRLVRLYLGYRHAEHKCPGQQARHFC